MCRCLIKLITLKFKALLALLRSLSRLVTSEERSRTRGQKISVGTSTKWSAILNDPENLAEVIGILFKLTKLLVTIDLGSFVEQMQVRWLTGNLTDLSRILVTSARFPGIVHTSLDVWLIQPNLFSTYDRNSRSERIFVVSAISCC